MQLSKTMVSIYTYAMGRLFAGQKPTPHKERQQLYRKELMAQGGRRVIADLEPQAAQALTTVMERDNLTIKEAIASALIHYAKTPK